MSGSGHTTAPHGPEDPSSHVVLVPRLAIALFIAWCVDEPWRAGHVAPFVSSDPGPFIGGREEPGDPARLHFLQLRGGESIDTGALRGITISREQFRLLVEGDALRLQNIGSRRMWVNGERLVKDGTVMVRPGDVIEVEGNCVLVVGWCPASFPPPPALFTPLHAFGEADRMGMYGDSWPMQQLRGEVDYAVTNGCHTLVRGQSGTGKERIARAIHDLSPRSAGPYIATNTASFTKDLTALELFGCPPNYPNSPNPERKGYLGMARGGTLLLDEIGEILESMQAPLLRALDGAYNRVGDPVARRTETVIVVATNRDESSVKHDVYHRLGATIVTPSLAERPQDIAQLVRGYLLEKAAEKKAFAEAFLRHDARGWAYVPVDSSLIVGLLRFPLPGNVRQLRKIVDRAVANAQGQPPLRWPPQIPMPAPGPLVKPTEPEPTTVDDLVPGPRGKADKPRATILESLERNGGNKSRTASELGLSRDQLYRLMIKYGIVSKE